MKLEQIKKDLLEDVLRDKYFLEQEMIRMVNSTSTINYRGMIDELNKIIGQIAISELKKELINQYFVGDKNNTNENNEEMKNGDV